MVTLALKSYRIFKHLLLLRAAFIIAKTAKCVNIYEVHALHILFHLTDLP